MYTFIEIIKRTTLLITRIYKTFIGSDTCQQQDSTFYSSAFYISKSQQKIEKSAKKS